MSLEQLVNDEERLAELDLEGLKRLVGLVEYEDSTDPFPVSGWDGSWLPPTLFPRLCN